MTRLQNFLCRWLGHRWHVDDRAAPVVPLFGVCRRCGKWERVRKAA